MATSSLRRNFIYNSMYQVLALILPLITTPYLSRILGADGIGEYGYYFSIAKYFVLFAMLGLNNYGNRTIAAVREDQEKLSKTFSSIYVMQLLFSVAALLLYIMYACLFNQSKMAIALILYVISAGLDINWFFFGLEQFKLTVARNTLIKLLSVACIFAFVKDQKDVYVYGLIMGASFLLSQIAVWPFVKKYTHFVKPTISEILNHIKPNLILFLPVIAVSLYKSMDKIMLGRMTDLKEVGFYQNSEKIIDIPESLIMALGTIMLPRMSNLVAKKDEKTGDKYIYLSILFAAFLSSSIGFGIAGVSPEFVPWYFGKGFEPCISIFAVLAPSTVFIALANVIRTQFLIPQHRDKIYVISVFLGAVVNILMNILLIPYLRATGAAIGTLTAEGVVCIYQFCMVCKEKDYLKPVIRAIPFLLSGIGMFVILKSFSLQFSSELVCIIVKALIGAAIYLAISAVIYAIRRWIFKKSSILAYD